MHYQHLKTIRNIKKIVLPAIPLFLGLFFLIAYIPLPQQILEITHHVAEPLWNIRNTVYMYFKNGTTAFQFTQSILQENHDLQQEIKRLQRQVYGNTVLQSENKLLRNLLSRKMEDDEFLVTSVIQSDTFSPYDTFMIDLGTSDGIRENMLAVTAEGIALGVVTKTYTSSSVITSFSSSKMTTDAILSATTTLHTTLYGIGGGTMKVSVPRNIELQPGDPFLLPAFTSYTIGKVAFIDVSPEDAYKEVHLQSPVNIHELRYILIDTTSSWNTKIISEYATATGTEQVLLEQ